MSYEWIAEKSNEWAVGQAWDLETNKAIDGPVDDGRIDDTLIERRALLGMNESGHANIYDAKLIAMAYSPVTGYATALRALLEARALLRQCGSELATYEVLARTHGYGTSGLSDKVRAFLAEGDR